jgi:pimeloyl-ACP methyl ester carboxylesterase
MRERLSNRALGPAIDGTRRQWRPAAPDLGDGLGRDLGQVCCYVADRQRGRPLVLVHDLRSTSSASEMRPLFESFRWRRPTFAIDLPGFGLSERSERSYPPALFALALAELLRKMRARFASADVVALGRGAEAASRVAHVEPGLIRSLAILEPAGLLASRDRGVQRLVARLALSLGDRAARGLFSLMVTRPSIRYSLRERFRGVPDAALLEYAHASAHVPGAHHAPLAAIASRPCHPETMHLYHSLTIPVLVVHDARGVHAIELEAFLRGRANRFAMRVSPTRGMPQFERRCETVSALERFWQSLSGAAWDQAMR